MSIVLVPVDFSDCSFEVVRYAARMARGLGTGLRLLHVLELPPNLQRDSVIQPDPSAPPTSAWEFVQADALRHMPLYEPLCDIGGGEVETLIVEGQPDEAILAASEDEAVEHIVMGTHGRRGFARLMTGSVAESVLRRATRPLTLIRAQHRDTCEALSCAWCTSGTLEAQRRLWSELSG